METMKTLLFLLLLLIASSAAAAAAAASSSFSLDFFPGTGAVAQLALSGAANATSGAVSMASPRARVQYKKPLVFSAAAGSGGFSTYFAFAIASQPPYSASLAFFLTHSPSPTAALAVVFSATHIRVEIAGRTALQTQSPAATARRRMHSWIDYNATSATLNVRLSAARLPNPPPALLSYPLDLSPLLRRGPMRAGFQFQGSSTSGGNCSLFSWAFHATPYRMHSQPLNPADLLTTPPPERVHSAPERRYSAWGAAVSLLFSAACGAMITFIVLFLWYSVASRRPVTPVEHATDVVYEKVVLVGAKDDNGGNK